MLNDPQALEQIFANALPYSDYVATGSPQHRQRWEQVAGAVTVTAEQRQLLESFAREMKILVVCGVWCGDCVEQCPLIAALADACPKIELRFIDRDDAPELRDGITLCAGQRIPLALFMAEDFCFCGLYGDRTLTRYRRQAERLFGSACSTGLFIPPEEEIAATMQDWLNEIERIQLMLRLSARLRKKHGD